MPAVSKPIRIKCGTAESGQGSDTGTPSSANQTTNERSSTGPHRKGKLIAVLIPK